MQSLKIQKQEQIYQGFFLGGGTEPSGKNTQVWPGKPPGALLWLAIFAGRPFFCVWKHKINLVTWDSYEVFFSLEL